LSAYGAWERDEDAFGDEDEDEPEPPVPAGLGSLTAPQRALADFLRVDADLLAVAAEASRPLAEASNDPRALARYIAASPSGRRIGCSGWSQAARRPEPGWNCCAASASRRQTSTPARLSSGR
jgi:hypothetical protein